MTRQPRPCRNQTSARPAIGMARRCKPLLLAALLVTLLPGCQLMVGGERTIAEENERLRRRNLQLVRTNTELEQRVAALENDARNLRNQLAGEQEMPAMEGVEPPRLARLSFNRLSGPVDLDGDQRHDVIRIYLQTDDQQGRILPVAGRVTLRAMHMPDDGEPEVMAERVYEPDELDKTWRHSFTGVHYTLELPLPDTLPEGETELTVGVVLQEAATGARHRHQQAMTVRR